MSWFQLQDELVRCWPGVDFAVFNASHSDLWAAKRRGMVVSHRHFGSAYDHAPNNKNALTALAKQRGQDVIDLGVLLSKPLLKPFSADMVYEM